MVRSKKTRYVSVVPGRHVSHAHLRAFVVPGQELDELSVAHLFEALDADELG